MPGSLLLLALLWSGATPVAELERGHRAFAAGDYREAVRALDGLAARLPRTGDYAVYLLAESQFYAGEPARARASFEALGKQRASRLAPVAPWRVADCLWAEGKRSEAGAAYRKLLRGSAPALADPVVARFRLAQLASGDEARRLFRQIHVDSPAHPLADEAARLAGGPAPTGVTVPTADPRERLKRAVLLAEGKHYQEAIDELDKLPPDVPPDLAAERDFVSGMARYNTRHDYPKAAQLLLGVVSKLSGEKAAHASFHGARALSRVDRDDEAIAGYKKTVQQFPNSKWAPEASFRAGWLDFNRGRFRESLPGLKDTLARYGKSAFANDAAWFLCLAHFLLDEPAQALPALEQYLRLSNNDADAVRRALYWRARILGKLGRADEARSLYRESVRRWPLDYYGLLARQRLEAEGEKVELPLVKVDRPPLPAKDLGKDPDVQRSDELVQAGFVAEAGQELERHEESIGKRAGREAALALLFDRYPRMRAFHRAYRLAENRGNGALVAQPEGAARPFWEAAYPRAYAEWVDKYGPPAGNPEFFIYSIMRKESGYDPHVQSPADARGLLQLIEQVGQTSAAELKEPFFADLLYDPETNVRLGAVHLGGLIKKVHGQIYLAAAAFNGGIGPVVRWANQNGKRPLDEFMELITYDQTREYAKRVVGIYAHYLYLYKGQLYTMPPVIDASFVKEP
ncbi:MAG TPA: transglycosylase SLT domain-containing protein [Polyangia bacterium]|nr:transglycosylase SLT domain-containing protein [Polyangia bacterium]